MKPSETRNGMPRATSTEPGTLRCSTRIWACLLALLCASSHAQTNYTFITFAGLAGGPGSADGTGTAARFNQPQGGAVDAVGNLYFADYANHTIRKISPAGVVTTLAGSAGNPGSVNAVGSVARFKFPYGVAVDAIGVVYVADVGNHTIRKITPAGVVSTLAGSAGVSGTNNGTGTAARFNSPRGVALDAAGNVYVGDYGNHTIRKITPAGAVTTLAGLTRTSGTNNGTGTAARFNGPRGVGLDSAGNVFVADSQNDTIRKITPAGAVSTLAGLAGNSGTNNGTGSNARFSLPAGISVDGAGNIYVADVFNNAIRIVTPAGSVSTLAGMGSSGNADGVGGVARFSLPYGVVADNVGNVFVGDTYNHTIRKIAPGAVVTTFAGLSGFGHADGPANKASFLTPEGVAADTNGTVYIADAGNHTIRKIAPNGIVTTFAGMPGIPGSDNGSGGGARFQHPASLVVDGAGFVYVSDTWNQTIRKITPDGTVTTFAGMAGAFGNDNGVGTLARFLYPRGMAIDHAGNLYVADSDNGSIRKITPGAVVTTLPGNFSSPFGVTVDDSGNVYVANSFDNTIGRIATNGAVSTLAGLSQTSGSTDGTNSLARFNTPFAIAVDPQGNLLIADSWNYSIRKMTPAGVVITVAGLAEQAGSSDGTGSDARFGQLYGMTIDGAGNVYVVDNSNHTIRRGSATPPNDHFANRSSILELPVSLPSFNAGGSRETGEPEHAGNPGGKSVWWTWTAPSNWPAGWPVHVDTMGSTFDTLLAVYTGSSVSSLVPSAANDDGDDTLTSSLDFPANPDATYQIAVDGYSGAEGIIQLNLCPAAMPNDAFAKALQLTGASATITGRVFGATLEPGEPVIFDESASIWYRWTAPTNGRVALTCTVDAGVYLGSEVSSLDVVATDYDWASSIGNRLVFEAAVGITYLFRVSGWNLHPGEFQLSLLYSPVNDDRANALPIVSNSIQISASNAGATHESGESDHGVNDFGTLGQFVGRASVWWVFNPPSDGVVELNAASSETPLILAGYKFDSPFLSEIANNFQFVGKAPFRFDRLLPRIRFTVQAGDAIYIVTDGYAGTEGGLTYHFQFTPAQNNNDFVSRFPLTTAGATGSNVGADLEPGEPIHAATGANNSVWWAWTPTQSGPVNLTIFGSTFDTCLEVYTGTGYGTLSLLASNDNAFLLSSSNGPPADPSSRVTFNAVAGTPYQIAVAGAKGAAGSISLNFPSLAIESILSSNRIALPDRSVDFTNTLRLRNHRLVSTGPVRLRLLARAGFSCVDYLNEDLNFRDTLLAPDEEIAVVELPAPGTLYPTSSLDVVVGGRCPPPYETPGNLWGFGRGVMALLEEQVGGEWQTVDGRLIEAGEWPNVGGYSGPGGGVITISSTLAGSGAHAGLLGVKIGPPAAVRLGGAWRISPTNFGELRELRFYTNYITNARTLAVYSTNFSVETLDLAGFVSPSNRAVTIVSGSNVQLNLMYSVMPPRLVFEAPGGLGITGTTGTAYRVESVGQLPPTNSWLPVTNITLGSGTNSIPGTAPVNSSNQFYRAVWLPD